MTYSPTDIGKMMDSPTHVPAIVERCRALTERMRQSLAGCAAPSSEQEDMLGSLILWLVVAEGVKVQALGKELIGLPVINGDTQEQSNNKHILQSHVSSSCEHWEPGFLSLLANVAWFLAPDAKIIAKMPECSLVFLAEPSASSLQGNIQLVFSLSQIKELGWQTAVAALADTAKKRVAEKNPSMQALHFDHDIEAWKTLGKALSD